MKPISNDFKAALKKIKQIDAIISYADRENTNFIITQNSNFLITQAQDFLVTESADVRIDNGGIQNCSIYWNTDIFKSVCKMIDLETSNAIPKGTEINIKIGLLVGDDYEYVDYGKFYINEEPNYNLDTGTYTTTGYDKMIFFNIKAIENPLTFENGVTYTLKQYLNMICDKCGVAHSFDFSNVINGDEQIISGDPYATNKDVTYRDIIDDIAECLGTNFIIDSNNKITNKEILMLSNMTIDADILKDTNVNIGEKKDAIDGLQVYDGSAILNYTGDDTSILKIKNNNIMNAHSDDLMAGVLSMIRDFVYYTYNLETFGILALEPFDCFTVSYNNTNYLLCSFHNDIKISSGLTEEISYEFNENDDVYEYSMSSSDDKLRDASIMIDKANGQIVLKANSNGKIVQAELSADASEGSAFNVKADNIDLTANDIFNIIAGNTLNLTSKSVTIDSSKFKVTSSGDLTCSNANITGGKINIESSESDPRIIMTGSGTYGAATNKLYYAGYKVEASNYTPIKLIVTHYDYGNTGLLTLTNDVGNTARLTARQFQLHNTSDTTTIQLTANSGNITCVSLTQTSLEENKKNIKKYDGALKEIMNTDIYKYNLKDENDKDKKHLGFVIGKDRKYSKEIVALDEEGNPIGVDNYSMTSLCLQAIKEQQEQIEELKNEIKTLKGSDK